MKVKLSITDSFDGGNIQFLSQSELIQTNPSNPRSVECTISLEIKSDVFTESEQTNHLQYFAFRSFVSGLGSGDNNIDSIIVHYEIVNAQSTSYPCAWPNSTVFYTTKSLEMCDDDSWKRNLTTDYRNGKLVWTESHSTNGPTFFAYYPPYTYSRHVKLISDCSVQFSRAYLIEFNPSIESLGQTTEGREMECISIGSGKLTAWIIHRQHPGETMAEFYAEGLLHRLFGLGADSESDDLDEVTKRMLTQYRLNIVPCMCPDGAVRGHIRCNGVGANLNREWATMDGYEAPTPSRSPEVYAVLNKMNETGCDFFLDVHGDEELPYVFFNAPVLTPTWGERMEHLSGYFISCYQRANSDVQKEYGYLPPENEESTIKTLNKASKQVSNRFDCLGLTLEMPFKDCLSNSDPEHGFSPRRAKQLGRNLVEALDDVSSYLRADGHFWREFHENDSFVLPKTPT